MLKLHDRVKVLCIHHPLQLIKLTATGNIHNEKNTGHRLCMA